MKLSMETYNLVKRFGEKKAIQMIKDAGFDSLDYSFYWLDDEIKKEVFGIDYLKHAKELRSFLDDIGITCNQAHASFDFSIDRDTMDMENENYSNIVKSLEIASVLGADNIIVHAIRPKDGESVFETNFKFYKSFEPYLQRFKIHLAIENLFGAPYDAEAKRYMGNSFDRPELMKEIIEKLDSEWFVCCIDVGHATLTGIEPQDHIRGMDNKLLKAVHIQDNDGNQDRHWLPYVGNINWDEVASSLKDIKYDGDITLEIFNFLKKYDDELIPEVLRFAEKTGRYILNKCL